MERSVEETVAAPDYRSLPLNQRRRVAREPGNKIEIRKRVREANQLRKIAIHCITFGDKNDTNFLKPMAEENGGRHIHIE